MVASTSLLHSLWKRRSIRAALHHGLHQGQYNYSPGDSLSCLISSLFTRTFSIRNNNPSDEEFVIVSHLILFLFITRTSFIRKKTSSGIINSSEEEAFINRCLSYQHFLFLYTQSTMKEILSWRSQNGISWLRNLTKRFIAQYDILRIVSAKYVWINHVWTDLAWTDHAWPTTFGPTMPRPTMSDFELFWSQLKSICPLPFEVWTRRMCIFRVVYGMMLRYAPLQ